MTLIWNELLHANFRCGRMYSARAENLSDPKLCTALRRPNVTANGNGSPAQRERQLDFRPGY